MKTKVLKFSVTVPVRDVPMSIEVAQTADSIRQLADDLDEVTLRRLLASAEVVDGDDSAL